MKFVIKKKNDTKHTITYIREGIKDYWIEADSFLVLHDICHYAIESTLNYKNAFWGLIANGINPSVFEKKETRDTIDLSNEAWYAEHLANLLLIEFMQGEFDDINQILNEIIAISNPGLPIINYSLKTINEIRNTIKQLFESWKQLSVGESLIFTFNI
jgi:hypothetical protein